MTLESPSFVMTSCCIRVHVNRTEPVSCVDLINICYDAISTYLAISLQVLSPYLVSFLLKVYIILFLFGLQYRC